MEKLPSCWPKTGWWRAITALTLLFFDDIDLPFSRGRILHGGSMRC
ncbi:MAG: hypothetical protein U0074_24485 [Kouleothrix sp.]